MLMLKDWLDNMFVLAGGKSLLGLHLIVQHVLLRAIMSIL